MARAEVQKLIDRMTIPVIAAPMFLVSNPALTLACCAEGVMGSFPAHGTRSREEFKDWLDQMQEGIKRLTTETGAGQWGTALSFATAQFDMECKVYMVRSSYEQKPYRRILMETWGGEVVPSPVAKEVPLPVALMVAVAPLRLTVSSLGATMGVTSM